MLHDAQGKEITGTLTVEETEKYIVAATEKTKTEYETKMAELNKKIEENANPALRKKAESAEKDKQELEKQITDLKESFAKNAREEALKPLAGSDAKFKEKLMGAYNRLKPSDETDMTAVSAAMADAYKLVSDAPVAGALHVRSGGYGGGAVPNGKSDVDTIFSPELKEMAKKGFGLSEEDIKKYADKVPSAYR